MVENTHLNIKELNDFALQNQKQKNFKIARATYEKILKIKSNIPSVQYNLALVLTELGEIEKAKKCYENVIKINPQIPDVYNNLGLIYYELGDHKKALNFYKSAIKINSNYANAYNNIGLLYAYDAKYEEAIENYSKALGCNNKHKDANKNLINALTYCQPKNNNPIVVANKNLKEINNEFSFENFIKKESLKKLFKKSKEVLDSIENDFNFVESIETQIYRRNSINLNCERHHDIFNEFEVIPNYCFSCFKIQIEPENVLDLIKLFFIFDKFKFPKNNWRKCMIELREGVKGLYKGFVYCSTIEEANQILEMINPYLNNFLKTSIKIKRGCTEFYKSYPDFNEIDKNKSNFMNYNKKWEKIENSYDLKKNKNKKKLIETNLGMTISDFLIMNNWLNFAKNINDLSYKSLSEDFYVSSFISSKLFNQIEFRKNQLLC